MKRESIDLKVLIYSMAPDEPLHRSLPVSAADGSSWSKDLGSTNGAIILRLHDPVRDAILMSLMMTSSLSHQLMLSELLLTDWTGCHISLGCSHVIDYLDWKNCVFGRVRPGQERLCLWRSSGR